MTTTSRNAEGPWHFDEFTIECSRSPRADLLASFWPVYLESFGPLRVLAAARQVLTEDEFAAELDDRRVWKYVAVDTEGKLAGVTTLTDDLATLPWISPEYFQHHYPDQYERGAVFYIGLSLVRPNVRHLPIFARMITCMTERIAAANGVVGYDVCSYNDEQRPLAQVTGRLLNRVAPFDLQAVDVQTYYVAEATGSEGFQNRD